MQTLEEDSGGNGNVVRLRSHKKKALMFALSNLSAATGLAYIVPNMMKGFIFNGQLDAKSKSLPSLKNLVNTYIGDVSETCLNDRGKLLDTYFEEMYLTGTIMEDSVDKNNLSVDRDLNNNTVLKSNNISTKNCHRAKVLSSNVQFQYRRKLVNEKHIEE